jgi:hypothetical protein
VTRTRVVDGDMFVVIFARKRDDERPFNFGFCTRERNGADVSSEVGSSSCTALLGYARVDDFKQLYILVPSLAQCEKDRVEQRSAAHSPVRQSTLFMSPKVKNSNTKASKYSIIHCGMLVANKSIVAANYRLQRDKGGYEGVSLVLYPLERGECVR